ncbi:MAG: FecR domain-containing protein [Acidobacteriota bacterium]
MSAFRASHDLDAQLDRAAAQIAGAVPDAEQVHAAGERVWQRLRTEARAIDLTLPDAAIGVSYAAPAADATAADRGELVAFPQRAGGADDASPGYGVRPHRASDPGRWLRMALAALVVMALGAALFIAHQSLTGGTAATIAALDGQLFRVEAASQLALEHGAPVAAGDRVRTGRDGGALLALPDGSKVEMRSRSEIAIDRGLRGDTVRLVRGSVIVQAAEQPRSKRLRVVTEDFRVAVRGTIFAVDHGTKGSRVSVVEGAVRVDANGDRHALTPGQQLTTHERLTPVPIADEVRWSRDADRYLDLLEELADLREELQQTARPDLRYASRLLDLVPPAPVLYAAAPNLTDTVRESHRLIRERLDDPGSPLGAWWQAQDADGRVSAELDQLVDAVTELGDYLGNEVVLSLRMTITEDGTPDEPLPLLLAEVVHPDGVRIFFEELFEDELGAGRDNTPLVFVDDPARFAAEPTTATDLGVYVWLAGDLLAAAPDLATLRAVQSYRDGAPNPFVGQSFHTQLIALYDEGAGLAIGVDLAQTLAQIGDAAEANGSAVGLARQLSGVDNLEHLILDSRRLDDRSHARAALTFREDRQGIASWLAAPAPMGALDFVSADASFALSAVFKSPSALLEDVYGMIDDSGGEDLLALLRAFEDAYGVDLQNDVAGSLGGEFAFALDGPLAPKPSWKVVMEVYDPARFQLALEQAVETINQTVQVNGQENVAMTATTNNGRIYHALETRFVDVHYTFVEGYVVMAPSRALIDRAIRFKQSGYTLTDSAKFRGQLPSDGRLNFSALVYQDMQRLIGGMLDAADAAGLSDQLNDGQRDRIEQLQARAEPTLIYAYGEPRRIILATAAGEDLLLKTVFDAVGFTGFGLGDLVDGFDPNDWDVDEWNGGAADADVAATTDDEPSA